MILEMGRCLDWGTREGWSYRLASVKDQLLPFFVPSFRTCPLSGDILYSLPAIPKLRWRTSWWSLITAVKYDRASSPETETPSIVPSGITVLVFSCILLKIPWFIKRQKVSFPKVQKVVSLSAILEPVYHAITSQKDFHSGGFSRSLKIALIPFSCSSLFWIIVCSCPLDFFQKPLHMSCPSMAACTLGYSS